MFEVKAATQMQIFAPFGEVNGPVTVRNGDKDYTDGAPWKPASFSADTILEKEDVFDAVALYNRPETVPFWMRSHIEKNRTVFKHNGAWYSIEQDKIAYLD